VAQAKVTQNKPEKPGNRPVHTIRFGVVRAAIWRNVIDNGNVPRDIYNVTFSRAYNDGKQWRDSANFGIDDLLVMAKAANEAHSWICQQRALASVTTSQKDPIDDDIHIES
jgi:hypothetical protein